MIVKNEIANIATLLDQVCPWIEQVVIVDTGSTDGTLEIIKRKMDMYTNLELHHFEWIKDFSAARNYSFSFATQEFVFWMDGDDQVVPEQLAKFKNNELNDSSVDCWILPYVYSTFPDGKPQIVLGRERFVRRSLNPKWVGAIHETIAIWNTRQKNSESLQIVHNREGKVFDYNRNVEILESEFAKNPTDPRTAYYYGKELFDRVNPKGLEILKHYLTLDGKYWDDAVNANFRLACDDLVHNKFDDAYTKASQIYVLDTSRERAEYYWIMGNIEQRLKNYKAAIRWYEICLNLDPESPRVVNREYYTWNPIQRITECYLELDNLDQAVRFFDKLVQVVGLDPVIELRSRIVSKFKPINGLIILDFLKIRSDAYHLSNYPSHLGEFADGFIHEMYLEDFVSMLKPKGFYWHVSPIPFPERSKCQTISKAVYKESDRKGAEIHNSIKIEKYEPFIFIPEGDQDFGPYRIRMRNLRNSLIKNGQKVVSQIPKSAECTVISQRLEHASYKYNVLDVCEWLPFSDYSEYGIQHADMVVCSSPLLAEKMKEKFPNKKISCVEDHVDMTDKEWL